MDKITRRAFKGNWRWVLLLCLTGIGIPVAVLYVIENTICTVPLRKRS